MGSDAFDPALDALTAAENHTWALQVLFALSQGFAERGRPRAVLACSERAVQLAMQPGAASTPADAIRLAVALASQGYAFHEVGKLDAALVSY